MSPSSPRRRAPRRSSFEVRQRLLDAAEELFAKQGYQATTTGQIVTLAGVDAPTLYRHFGSKAELFEVVALGPLNEFLDGHFEYWSSRPVGEVDPVETMERFAKRFFALLHDHRETLRLLVSSSRSDDVLGEVSRRVATRFREGLVPLQQIVAAESEVHGYRIQSPDVTLAAATGMVMAMVLFDDWVFPAGRVPSRQRQIDEIVDLVLYGVTRRAE